MTDDLLLDEAPPKKAPKRVSQEALDLQQVMGSASGRRFVWKQLGICGVYRTSFTGNATTYFNEGRRDVGLQLIADLIEFCPNEYLLMQSEQQVKKEIE